MKNTVNFKTFPPLINFPLHFIFYKLPGEALCFGLWGALLLNASSVTQTNILFPHFCLFLFSNFSFDCFEESLFLTTSWRCCHMLLLFDLLVTAIDVRIL